MYNNENQLSFFCNQKIAKSGVPYFSGSSEINGKSFWVSVFEGQKDGRKYLKINLTEKNNPLQKVIEQPAEQPKTEAVKGWDKPAVFDDEIPF